MNEASFRELNPERNEENSFILPFHCMTPLIKIISPKLTGVRVYFSHILVKPDVMPSHFYNSKGVPEFPAC